MKAIVGLGNPGKEYEKTRHNAGFIALDKIASDNNFEKFSLDEKFEAEISRGEMDGEKTILVKPQTFMNASGRAVQKIMAFYKIKAEDLIIIHDELDIPLGEMRTGFGRSAAGHKGVQSIMDSLNSKDFNRIRIGVKIEDRKIPTEKYVLGNFNGEEFAAINKIIDIVSNKTIKELI